MARKIILEIIAFLFILLFLYTAGSKLSDLEKFRVVISKSPLLYPAADVVAVVIPLLEVVVAILIAIPRTRYIGLFGAFTLMVIFTAYITAILQLSENIPCSCGGVLQQMGWREHLVFNVFFSLLGLSGIILSIEPNDPMRLQQRSPDEKRTLL